MRKVSGCLGAMTKLDVALVRVRGEECLDGFKKKKLGMGEGRVVYIIDLLDILLCRLNQLTHPSSVYHWTCSSGTRGPKLNMSEISARSE